MRHGHQFRVPGGGLTGFTEQSPQPLHWARWILAGNLKPVAPDRWPPLGFLLEAAARRLPRPPRRRTLDSVAAGLTTVGPGPKPPSAHRPTHLARGLEAKSVPGRAPPHGRGHHNGAGNDRTLIDVTGPGALRVSSQPSRARRAGNLGAGGVHRGPPGCNAPAAITGRARLQCRL